MVTDDSRVPSRLLVVVPTFQESANISMLLNGIHAAVPDAQVLVVDDGSPDGTAAIAEAVGRELGNVEVIRRMRKEGLGPAYRAGFQWGLDREYAVLASMDADLSHDPASLPVMLDAVDAGAHCVIGSRYVDGGSIPDWSLHRRALSRWGNRYAAAGLRLGVRDATSGYRAYCRDALCGIELEDIRADGYAFQIELVYRLLRQGRSVVEVPIAFIDRQAGESKMSAPIIMEAFGLVTGWAVRDGVRSVVTKVRHR